MPASLPCEERANSEEDKPSKLNKIIKSYLTILTLSITTLTGIRAYQWDIAGFRTYIVNPTLEFLEIRKKTNQLTQQPSPHYETQSRHSTNYEEHSLNR